MLTGYTKMKKPFIDRTISWGQKHLSKQKMIVFYDGWCPMCQKVKEQCEQKDLFKLVQFVSFRNPEVAATYSLDIAKLEKRMHSKVIIQSEIVDAINSIIQLAKRILVFWPLLPFLLISKYIGIGQVFYDYIAKRRKIVATNHCSEVCIRGPIASNDSTIDS